MDNEIDVKNKSLGKALMILDAFASAQQELGITELSEMLGLYKSNIHNVVSTLESFGYLVKNKTNGKYSVGMKFVKFSYVALNQFTYRKILLPYLTILCYEFNEHMTITIPMNYEVLYLDSIYPLSTQDTPIKMGHTLPLHCTSEGKVMMAYQQGLLESFLQNRKLVAFTSNTITDPEKLRKVVEETRQNGYGFASMEYTSTNTSVAVPIFDRKKNLQAVLTVAGPAQHFTKERCEYFVNRMQEIAKEVSEFDEHSPLIPYSAN